MLSKYYPNELAVLILWFEVMMRQKNLNHQIFYDSKSDKYRYNLLPRMLLIIYRARDISSCH